MTSSTPTKESKETDDEKSVYLGNAVPKILRVTYIAFAVWALIYLGKFLVPDLLSWLKK